GEQAEGAAAAGGRLRAAGAEAVDLIADVGRLPGQDARVGGQPLSGERLEQIKPGQGAEPQPGRQFGREGGRGQPRPGQVQPGHRVILLNNWPGSGTGRWASLWRTKPTQTAPATVTVATPAATRAGNDSG